MSNDIYKTLGNRFSTLLLPFISSEFDSFGVCFNVYHFSNLGESNNNVNQKPHFQQQKPHFQCQQPLPFRWNHHQKNVK